jgi:peroxiredoxin
MLADADGRLHQGDRHELHRAAGGLLIDRSKRYAMLVEDGVVKVLHVEEGPGTCEVSGGEALLDAI